jgi:regulator of protease activity HflC (stomatin/prohibitin superfamily)
MVDRQKNKQEVYQPYKKLWIAGYLVVVSFIVVALAVFSLFFLKEKPWYVFYPIQLLAPLFVGFLLYKNINILKPDEMGIKVFLGASAEEGIDSGFHWTWWPLEKIVRYPKELMEFRFVVKSVVTRRGKVEGYGDEFIEPADINVVCTLYAQFDREQLNKTVQNSPGNNAQDLGPFLIPYVTDTVRALGGRLPWRVLNQERHYAAQWILARLVGGEYREIKDGDTTKPIKFVTKREELEELPYDTICELPEELKDRGLCRLPKEKLENISPFVIIGLKNVSFAIEDLNFTNPELAKNISAPESARLESEATVIKAEATKKEKALEGEGEAIARKAKLNAIKGLPEFEAMDTLKEIGRGPSNFVFPLDSLSQIIKAIKGGAK